MPNHVHLVVVPRTESALARALARTNGEYAQKTNYSERRTGHLWQNRFYSCPMSNSHLWAALRYVERNPVRAGFLTDATLWPWSSASYHVTEDESGGIRLRWDEWRVFFDGPQWRTFLSTPGVAEEAVIRSYTRSGKRLDAEWSMLALPQGYSAGV
jgi:putative transposase